MEKILTVSIAAYNVEKYIENTLDSLLVDNIDDLEILIEDDGGNDKTSEIVKGYEEKYPGIVKFVHKENGGYGSTINNSIKLAKGKYFKQLDGDDWYNKENFGNFLEILRKSDDDVIYTPYEEIVEGESKKTKKDFFPSNIEGSYKINEVIPKANHYLNMYTVTYKTENLRKQNVQLIENCLYTDTQYAMYPMKSVSTIFISHIPIYVYRLGRDGQSVSFSSRIKHYEDHVKVTRELINFVNTNKFASKEIKKYLMEYVGSTAATTIADFFMLLPCKKENKKKIIDFEMYIKEKNETIYNYMAEKRKIVKNLRKSRYTLYSIFSILQKKKFK